MQDVIFYFLFLSVGGFLGNERKGQGEVMTGCWFLRFMFYLGAKNKWEKEKEL